MTKALWWIVGVLGALAVGWVVTGAYQTVTTVAAVAETLNGHVAGQPAQVKILRQICRNTAPNDAERAACDY